MKRKTPKLTGPDDDRLAAKWGCDCRTIRRWRKAGAPFSNPKRLREWLSSRKHLPAGTAALLETTRAAEASAFKQEPPLPEGAAGALQRLEQAEARAFAAFK